ncbi:MAG: hypothetical protein ACRDJW_08070 [Thermomicrobiales bacterium]
MRRTSPTNTEGPTAIVRSGSTFYSLWDVDTGTSLGTYDTEEEVWEIILALVEANGPEYADALDLALEDTEGAHQPIAAGSELVAMAESAGHARTR